MRKRTILSMPRAFLLASLLAVFAVIACPATAQQRAAMTAPGMGGEQTCLKCHGGDPRVRAILESPMGRKGDNRTPMAQLGCQGCHGLSDDHVAGKKPFPDIVFEGPMPRR